MPSITPESNKAALVASSAAPLPTEIKRAQWRNHVSDWKQSGLSQKAFCESRGLKAHQLSYYRQSFARMDVDRTCQTAPSFVPLRVSSETIGTSISTHPHPAFKLQLTSGCVLDIPTNYDVGALHQLFTLLGVIAC